MQIHKDTLICDIVASNYKTATVFAHYKIDFCCNGNRSLQEAIKDTSIEMYQLIDAIQNIIITKGKEENFVEKELDQLANYIYDTHHTYVESQIPTINQYLEKIVKVHSSKHPELIEINKLFKESSGDLIMHMKKEELILFPYIKKMAEAKRTKTLVMTPGFGTIQNPIAMMHEEHDGEGERFRKIAKLTNNYQAPQGACNTFRLTYQLLQEFEKDLHKHIHLENNILFKKAIEIEAQLN